MVKNLINKYYANFKYIIKHKINVGIECIKMGMFCHAITHDLSKFFPSEFIPYTNNFYGSRKNHRAMDEAWQWHKNRNPHHWDFWVKGSGCPIPMPEKYVKQMVADWKGMGRQPGFDGAISYYTKTKHRMVLHKETIKLIHKYLLEV